jgi:RNA polymerase sigma-70 factor, ECF subfamily
MTPLLQHYSDSRTSQLEVAGGEGEAVARVTFEEAYERHFADVWRAARSLGVAEAEVEDVVQDVFEVVLRRLSTFEGRSSLRTWLYGVLLRVVQNRRRTRRRRPEEADMHEVRLPEPRSPETPLDAMASHEASALLERLLATLTPERREVFVMVELEELSVPEIAALLNENINTLYTRLRLARADFERALDRHRAQAQRDR